MSWYDRAIQTTVDVDASNTSVKAGSAMATIEKSEVPRSVLAPAAARTAHFEPAFTSLVSAAIGYFLCTGSGAALLRVLPSWESASLRSAGQARSTRQAFRLSSLPCSPHGGTVCS